MTETVVERPDFTEIWHCEQPEVYRVLRDEWVEDYTVRHVYEVQEVTPPE